MTRQEIEDILAAQMVMPERSRDNYPAHYLLPTGTLGIASLPTDEVGSRQMVMPERSRRQLSSALSSSNGKVGHSFASDG